MPAPALPLRPGLVVTCDRRPTPTGCDTFDWIKLIPRALHRRWVTKFLKFLALPLEIAECLTFSFSPSFFPRCSCVFCDVVVAASRSAFPVALLKLFNDPPLLDAL